MTHTAEPLAPTIDTRTTSSVSPAVPAAKSPARGRGWALFGVAAAASAAVGLVAEGALSAYYDKSVSGDVNAVAADVLDHPLAMSVFHIGGAASAVLLLPFAAGLYRRLRQGVGSESLAPAVASFGLLVMAMVATMGTVFDTEMGIFNGEPGQIPAEHLSFYAHWTASVPGVWTAVGMAGIAVFVAWRQGGVSRAQGITGLVLGSLTVLLGVSPLEYMSVLPGFLWLLAASLMFLLGDKAHRKG